MPKKQTQLDSLMTQQGWFLYIYLSDFAENLSIPFFMYVYPNLLFLQETIASL